jgi:uncharacterized protein YndB with AHSA1/START domain
MRSEVGKLAAFLITVACIRVGAITSERQGTLHVAKPSDTEIVLTRSFPARREVVFAALTEAAHRSRWMTPTDMTLVTCEVDVRVGGSLRYVFERPSGRRLEVRGVFEVVEPPGRFVYMESYDFSPLKVLVTTILDRAEEKTVFTQTLRYASRRERDEDFTSVATSASEVYDTLERYLLQHAK